MCELLPSFLHCAGDLDALAVPAHSLQHSHPCEFSDTLAASYTWERIEQHAVTTRCMTEAGGMSAQASNCIGAGKGRVCIASSSTRARRKERWFNDGILPVCS